MKSIGLTAYLCIFLLVASQLYIVSGQFSFSLPGKWGNGKRSNRGVYNFVPKERWSQLERSKIDEECAKTDIDMLSQIYSNIQEEAMVIRECLQKLTSDKQL